MANGITTNPERTKLYVNDVFSKKVHVYNIPNTGIPEYE